MSRDVTLPTSASGRSELQQVQFCVTLVASNHVGWFARRAYDQCFGRGNTQTNKQWRFVPLGELQHLGESVHGDSWMLQCCTPHGFRLFCLSRTQETAA